MTTYITKDTQETVEFRAPHGKLDQHGFSLDGYDWMDAAATTDWHTLSSWGKDGWDAGSWPYVILTIAAGRDEVGKFFGMTTFCEGDLETTFYRSQAAHWEAISRWNHWNWANGQSQGPTGMPKVFEECGPEIRRPYGDEFDAAYAAMTGAQA